MREVNQSANQLVMSYHWRLPYDAMVTQVFLLQWITVPFAMVHESVGSLALNETDWLGSIEPTSPEWGLWIDYWLLLICGGIPWQVRG